MLDSIRASVSMVRGKNVRLMQRYKKCWGKKISADNISFSALISITQNVET